MRADVVGIDGLVDEYETFVQEAMTPQDSEDPEQDCHLLAEIIIQDGEWTSAGATALVEVARNYGSFFLRNALALALALRVEDGDLGF